MYLRQRQEIQEVLRPLTRQAGVTPRSVFE
jgi:hypothetical protein